MRKCIFLYLLLNVIYAVPMRAFDFKWLDVKSGLTDNTINCILRDSYGFMWFATNNGLSRYDGYHFKHYHTTQLGAYSNKINSINEDGIGNIWIHSAGTLFHYNRNKDVLDNDISSILSWLNLKSNVEQLFVDHNRNLWCSVGKTLIYYNYVEEQKSVFVLPENESIKWLECRDKKAYILFNSGLVGKVDFKTNSIHRELTVELSSDFHHKIYIDYTYNIWFYTAYSPDNVLRKYNPLTKTWSVLTDKAKHVCDFIASVTDDGKGNIWVGSVDAGIFIYHPDKDDFTHIVYEKNNPFSLPTNHVNCFYKDKQNIMWVGTSKRGIAFTSLDNVVIKKDKLSELDDISCILEDTHGNIWLGSDGEGVVSIDTSVNKPIRFDSKNGSIPTNLIVCSFLDSKNRIWFGTYGGGVFYYDKNKFVNLNINDRKIANLLKDIRSIGEDAIGNIWLGTIDKGLFCYDTAGNIEHYTMENTLLPTNSITDLYCNFGKNLYISTSSGLCVMDIYSRQLSLMKSNARGTQSLPNALITCVYLDERNLLWVGGQDGICVFDMAHDSIFNLTTENGLSHNLIRGITEDLSNNIWVTTDFGVTNIVVVKDPMLKVPTFRCYSYFDEDGLGNITFNNHSILCNRHGEVLMGGMGGYIKVVPVPMQFNQLDSKVVFTALHIANNLVEVGEAIGNGRIILSQNIQLAHEITLDYSNNTFSLDVSSMNYESSRKITFFYRLSDNANWIKLEGNAIHFNALPAGTYNLQVRASYNRQYWINEPTSLIIRVEPPFWLSTTAYLFYLLLFLVVFLMVIIRMHRKAKFREQKHAQELAMAKQHEIDEAKMRFLTNISHDLRTPLSLIITPIEKLLKIDLSDNSAKKDLELIHRNAVLMMDEVNQLLDLRKLDNGKSVLNLSHGNLSEFIKEVCGSFECYTNNKGIRLDVILKMHSIETNFDKNKMQRVMMNLLSNAFKYNVEEGSIVVTVDSFFESEREFARIQVADTGIGILDKNKTMIFERFYQEKHTATYIGSGIGLHIVKEYVLMHGGRIEVRDNIPQGAIFIITLPIATELELSIQEEESADSEMKETVAEYPILIVEDNDDFRKFLMNCLKDHYKVIAASHGKQALALMAKQPVQLVISDVMMPVMNGYELCNSIKGDIRFSHIPVILLTARISDEHILKGLKEGADDYITKPFNLEILLLRINKLIEWGKNNHKRFIVDEIKPSEITISSLDEQLISKAIALVEENMSNSNYSVEDLSADIGMSRGHFYKKLIAITGKAPKEFVITLRIKRGRQLIEKSQLNVSEIAYQVGLSPKQFTKYYKDAYGELPSSYKKNNH